MMIQSKTQYKLKHIKQIKQLKQIKHKTIYLIIFLLLLIGVLCIFIYYYKTQDTFLNNNDNNNVFLYWTGNEYKLIKILRDIIYLHSNNNKNYTVHLINKENLKNYIKIIPEYFNDLLPAHQADFVRVNVVCNYGGIWLDSDTLVMDDLCRLFDIFKKKDGFFLLENNQILFNGVFGSKPNTPLMIEWKTKLLDILNNKKQNIDWTEIGNSLLDKIKKNNPEYYNNYKIFNGLDNMYPVNWNNCVEEFITKPYNNYKIIEKEFQPIIVLVNSVYKELEKYNEKEILNSNLPLNYFINKSYNKSYNKYINLI